MLEEIIAIVRQVELFSLNTLSVTLLLSMILDAPQETQGLYALLLKNCIIIVLIFETIICFAYTFYVRNIGQFPHFTCMFLDMFTP